MCKSCFFCGRKQSTGDLWCSDLCRREYFQLQVENRKIAFERKCFGRKFDERRNPAYTG